MSLTGAKHLLPSSADSSGVAFEPLSGDRMLLDVVSRENATKSIAYLEIARRISKEHPAGLYHPQAHKEDTGP